MKVKGVIITLGILAAAVAYVVRQARLAAATGLDLEQKRSLLRAMERAHASTIAALDPGAAPSDPESRDRQAAADAQALDRAFEEVQPLLKPGVSSLAKPFVETIGSAQLQIMAFAINRKNRGIPDVAQIEAESNDLAKLRERTEPLLGSLSRALA